MKLNLKKKVIFSFEIFNSDEKKSRSEERLFKISIYLINCLFLF
jgi:hypothetical protein